MVALPVLVSGLEAEMIRLGYKDSTMIWYRGAWRRLQRYFTARGVEEFSLDVAMAWVDEACGFFAKEQAGTLRQTDVYLFRVAQMLGDYETHGAVLRRYSRTVSRLSADEAAVVARFGAWLRAAERSASTVRSYGTLAGEFTAFAGTRGGLARCDAGTIGAFTATLAGYQAKTVEQKLCGLRSFLRFASEAGLTAAAAEAVPAVPSRRQARIPSVWDPGDVARILDAVDRGNPCGKRDYAIILLVARLGLRSIDNAETILARALDGHHARAGDEAYALIREALATSGDIHPGPGQLLIRLDPLTAPRRTQALAALCDQFNQAGCTYPGTDLTLRYEVKPHPGPA